MKAALYRMGDTSLYCEDFKFKLLQSVDVDSATNGVLVHSDNFQGLRSIRNRYKEQIKCIYIDPPYNTSEATFFYKNQYKHSSWLAPRKRFSGSKAPLSLMAEDAILQITIDDEELYRLKGQVDSLLGEERYGKDGSHSEQSKGRSINSLCHQPRIATRVATITLLKQRYVMSYSAKGMRREIQVLGREIGVPPFAFPEKWRTLHPC